MLSGKTRDPKDSHEQVGEASTCPVTKQPGGEVCRLLWLRSACSLL